MAGSVPSVVIPDVLETSVGLLPVIAGKYIVVKNHCLLEGAQDMMCNYCKSAHSTGCCIMQHLYTYATYVPFFNATSVLKGKYIEYT